MFSEMLSRLMTRTIIFLCHLHYKKFKKDIFYIKGTGKDYPKYLLYTEKESTYKRMDNF